ncbi:MAG: MMPL family transporter [Arachnia sp.]
MALLRVPTRLPDHLTSRRGAWTSLTIALIVFIALFGVFGRATAPSGNDAAPPSSESAQVSTLLADFPDADEQSVLVVGSRTDDGDLSPQNLASMNALKPLIDLQTGHQASRAMPSEDGMAAVMITPVTVGSDNAETAQVIKDLRASLDKAPIAGVNLQVTGGPAFGADVTSSFDGANLTLLLVTILIVAVLLIATYRSPVLWLLPLLVVAFADQLANKVTAFVGTALELQFDAGIISVLVFGAGTNYALLLISRYREELLISHDHRAALASAWRKTLPAILASNVTVVLSLLTLAFAVIPGTRGLGISSAVGLLIALLAVLLALPPVLAVCGRKVFWPFVPKPGTGMEQGKNWRAVAAFVVRRPLVGLGAGLLLLSVMATGLFGTQVGLSQVEKFRVASESAVGLEVLSQHFPAGESQPHFVVAATPQVQAVVEAASGVDGVLRAAVTGETADGQLSRIMVTGEDAPSSPESLELVTELRDVVHAIPDAEALVGGATATDLDARAGNSRDLLVIAPLVLAVSFIVLLLLLRSVVAPLLLMLVNLVSAGAAIGAGSFLSGILFGQEALDLQVPLLAFMFLVALGIDYTIFLVHRARAEAHVVGTRSGMINAVTHTGSVITSAGIVLAAVFAALGVLPLVTLGQLGLIVGLGVVVDTLVVRTIIVPALFGLLGDRMWWPQSIEDDTNRLEEPHREQAGVLVG